MVLAGNKRSNQLKILIVCITLAALAGFLVTALPVALRSAENLADHPTGDGGGTHAFLYATALMFVAFTGYGRIATLGEEVLEPQRTIPGAIAATLVVTAIVYILVAVAVIGTVGADRFAAAPRAQLTPLEVTARALDRSMLAGLVALGANDRHARRASQPHARPVASPLGDGATRRCPAPVRNALGELHAHCSGGGDRPHYRWLSLADYGAGIGEVVFGRDRLFAVKLAFDARIEGVKHPSQRRSL